MRSTSCGFEESGPATGSALLVKVGPTLLVDIGFDADFAPGGDKGRPELPMKGVHALVDTGATTSCIDSQLALALDLPIVDQSRIAGVSGERTVNMHLAQIYVPALDHTVYGQFAGVDLAAGGQAHSALIGRTFLRNFKMIYDGTTGKVIICEPAALDIPELPFPKR